MWLRLGQFILKYRIPLLILLIGSTFFMGIHASRVQLSYDFARAIPIDNPKYKAYQEFRNKFGEDGNLMVISRKNLQRLRRCPTHFKKSKWC